MLDAEFVDWLSVSVAEAVAEPYVSAQEQEERRALGLPPPQYKPFGGHIQLIFCGDFLQLPPVQVHPNPSPNPNPSPSPSPKLRTPRTPTCCMFGFAAALALALTLTRAAATRRLACARRRAASRSMMASRTGFGSARRGRPS